MGGFPPIFNEGFAMSNFDSFAVFDRELVKKATKYYIDSRKQRIFNRRTEEIEKAMQEKRWFRKNRTREEAIKYLKQKGNYTSLWLEIAVTGSYYDSSVMALYDLAKESTDDKVYVTSEMASVLRERFGNCWKEENHSKEFTYSDDLI